MKVIGNLFTNEIVSVYPDDDVIETRKNCYTVNTHQINDSKKVKLAAWKQIKDEKNNLLWDGNNQLKPLMGYEVQNEEVKIQFNRYFKFWTIQEVLMLKYKYKLKDLNYSHMYYEEFLDDHFPTSYVDGNLNFGKKICYGNGMLIHGKLELSNNKICFDCEYKDELPNLEISLDRINWTKIKEVPFIYDFKKIEYVDIFLKINDYQNQLTAYSIAFNTKDERSNDDLIGRGIVTL